MYKHRSKKESGSCMTVDMWGPFRGKYPDPTPEELNLIFNYLSKFACEDEHFVEYRAFKSLKKRLNSPNLRQQLIRFIRQVRGSKGYDVDLYFDFITYPYTNFIPRSLDDSRFYDEAMAATTVAVREINTRMVCAGKRYELVRVDKSVLATPRGSKEIPGQVRRIPITINVLLLTFTANEITILAAPDDDGTGTGTGTSTSTSVVVLQAMLIECEGPPSTFQLKEWKYKPIPSSYHIDDSYLP